MSENFRHFKWKNKKYILKESVLCTVDYRGNLWIYEVPGYGMHSYSSDRHQAFMDLNQEFDFLYNGLVDEKDESLTLDAIELRDKIRNNVLRVEEIFV